MQVKSEKKVVPPAQEIAQGQLNNHTQKDEFRLLH